jgi:hypothetical protein
VNSIYKSTSWTKPRCLRGQELTPFMDPDFAARVIQGLNKMNQAKTLVNALLVQKFHKIFDRTKGRFYYVFAGKSKLIARQSWVAPRLCSRPGYRDRIHAVYTDDVAAILIQQKWRTFLMKKLFKALTRANYMERWDPIQLRYKYTNINTDQTTDQKPILLGSDKFDPNDVSLWNVDRVVLFIRRLGYRKFGYCDILKRFNIDGQLVLFFDNDDFADIGIRNRIHIRRIQIELEKIYPMNRREAISAIFKVKREKMRRFKQLEGAAIDIQRLYRGHSARTERRYLKEIERISHMQEALDEKNNKVGVWWLQQKVPRAAEPLKDFGRKRDHFSVKGWGRWVGNEWQGIPNSKEQGGQKSGDEYLASNITRKLTEELHNSGYDRRRQGELTGVLALKLKSKGAADKPRAWTPSSDPPPPPDR